MKFLRLMKHTQLKRRKNVSNHMSLEKLASEILALSSDEFKVFNNSVQACYRVIETASEYTLKNTDLIEHMLSSGSDIFRNFLSFCIASPKDQCEKIIGFVYFVDEWTSKYGWFATQTDPITGSYVHEYIILSELNKLLESFYNSNVILEEEKERILNIWISVSTALNFIDILKSSDLPNRHAYIWEVLQKMEFNGNILPHSVLVHEEVTDVKHVTISFSRGEVKE